MTDRIVDHWIGSGYLLKVLPAVFALGRPATEAAALWMAAVLLAGPRSVLAGNSAAAASGIAAQSPEVHVVRPQGHRRLMRGTPPHEKLQVVVRKANLVPEDIVYHGPIPVLEPARLLIDLAGRVGEKRLRRYFIEAGTAGLLTPQCLSRIASRSPAFTGRKQLLVLHSHWDPSQGRIRSVLEGEFKLMCAEQDLPLPLTNQQIGRYEVDCLWEDANLIVELDGRRFHDGAVALANDSEKTRYLRNLGYKVLRFTWNDVTERPEWVAGEIRKELGAFHPPIAGQKRTQVAKST